MHHSRNKYEFNDVENMNPLQAYELIFQQKLFLPVLDPSLQERVTPLVFRVTRPKNQERLVIYILSESDLYFLYRVDLPIEKMHELNDYYKLHLKKLPELVDLLKTSLEDIQNQSKIGTVEITQNYNSKVLDFQIKKVVGGKTYIVMKLSGQSEHQEMITDHVAFIYGSTRQRIFEKESRIEQLKELVRLKNPYLLKHFKPA